VTATVTRMVILQESVVCRFRYFEIIGWSLTHGKDLRRNSLVLSLWCGFRKRVLFADGIEVRFGRFAAHTKPI
jgi:hypothetical protein